MLAIKRKYLYQGLALIFATVVIMAVTPAVSASARTVVDPVGRRMQIPRKPERIVALAPSITEIVFALEQAHRLKGATQFSDYPPEARRLPRVGSYVKLDIERIIALKPDLCIAIKDGNPKGAITRIEALNTPVFAVNPTNLETVMETILALGDLLDAQPKAHALVDDMRARIQDVATRVQSVTSRPRVFLQIGLAPIVSAGTNTFIHELIIKAGGENIAQGPASYPRFSIEDIIRLKPDILVITSMARGAIFEEVKAGWQRWKAIPAVANQRIHVVNSDLTDRPSPRLVDGLESLARIIHPTLFTPKPANQPQ